MVNYALLFNFIGAILAYHAWQERVMDNRRDSSLLGGLAGNHGWECIRPACLNPDAPPRRPQPGQPRRTTGSQVAEHIPGHSRVSLARTFTAG